MPAAKAEIRGHRAVWRAAAACTLILPLVLSACTAEQQQQGHHPSGTGGETVTVVSAVGGALGELAGKEARRYLRLLNAGAAAHGVALRAFGDIDAAAASALRAEGETALATGEGDGGGAAVTGTDVVVVAVKASTAVHLVLAQWDGATGGGINNKNGTSGNGDGDLPRGHEGAVDSLRLDDAHLIRSVRSPNGRAVTACVGATERAALYCVYTLAESMGARFTLSGDLLPPPPSLLARGGEGSGVGALPPVGTTRILTPSFAVRGIQPFHDFPMGPDWWQPQFWKSLTTNMAKMKLNFYGFHTYPVTPTPGSIAEPLVWIGHPDGYDKATGAVYPASAYDTSWYLTQDFYATGTANTSRRIRGNVPGQKSVAASSFCCGAALAFPRDCYGSDAQADICYPSTPAESAKVFNNAAALITDAFRWGAGRAGVDGAVGVEFPLSLPPGCNATLSEAYEGMLGRVVALGLNISTFWLWTNEGVENHGNGKGKPESDPLWGKLLAEIDIARAAAEAVNATFELGTSGWCLGPGDNPAYFDQKVADPRFVVSSINGALGWLAPDPAFATMQGNRSIAIPWMEDDLSLAGAELWVNRTLEHAALARKYGTEGLLGLLWRTWETSPQLAALARAGWDDTGSDVSMGAARAGGGGGNVAGVTIDGDDDALTDRALYTDFCSASFGNATAGECADLFLAVDSFSPSHPPGAGVTPGGSKLPRDGQRCCGGPMGNDNVPVGNLLNLSGFEAWLSRVQAGEDADRADRAARWVSLFRYHSHAQLVSNASAALAALAARPGPLPPGALAAARDLSGLYEEMMTHLLEATTTPGELGMLAAHGGANWPSVFNASITSLSRPRGASCKVTLANATCYQDHSPNNRTFPHTAWISDETTTQESCAAACGAAGMQYAAVEYSVACFCGGSLPPPSLVLPRAACDKMKCAGNKQESCGDADIMLVYSFTCDGSGGGGLTPAEVKSVEPTRNYTGRPRVFETAPRSVVAQSESGFAVEVTVLSATPPSAVLLHVGSLAPVAMARARDPITGLSLSQVYGASAPLSSLPDEFDYHVTAAFGPGGPPPLRHPIASNQSVVVVA